MKSIRCVLVVFLFLGLIFVSGNASAQALSLSVDHQPKPVPGQLDYKMTFTFRVTNTSDNDLANVTISTGDPSIDAQLNSIDLLVGEEAFLNASYALTQDDLNKGYVELGPVSATGFIVGCEFQCEQGSNVISSYFAQVDLPPPDLSITKSVDANPATVGEEFSYTITIANNGEGPSDFVRLVDAIPAGLSLLSISPQQLCSGIETVNCDLGRLDPGASRIVSLTVVADEGTEGSVVNTACVEELIPQRRQSQAGGKQPGLQASPNQTEICASAETTVISSAAANLQIRKDGSVSRIEAGGTFFYTIAVENRGPGDAVNVVVTDPLPDEVIFESSTCPGETEPEDADCAYATIPAGETRRYTVTVAVNETAEGEIVNTAEVTSDNFDPYPGSNTATERTPIIPPEDLEADVAVSKNVDQEMAEPGDTLRYSITVRNDGPDDAVNVVVTDSLPPGVTFLSSTCAGGGTTCELGDMAANASVSFEIAASVNSDAPELLTNTATVASETVDPNPSNDSDSATTIVERADSTATFTVQKDFDDDNPQSVQVALTCTAAEVDQPVKPASESGPAIFNLNNVGADNNCTATEQSVPDGYIADASGCSSLAAGPGGAANCTIFNSVQPSDETTITVNVTLLDDNASVDVTLSCTDATIEGSATKSASNDSPAMFMLSSVGANNTCSVKISGAPDGTVTDSSTCQGITVEEGQQQQCQVISVDLPDIDLPDGSNPADVANTVATTCGRGNNIGGFQELCDGLIGAWVSGGSVEEALYEITPDDAASVRSTGMQTTNVQVSAVDGRLGTLRGGGGAGFSASGFSAAVGDMALNGSLLKSFLTALDQNNPDVLQANANQNDSGYLDEFGRWGIWVSGRLVLGKKDRTTNQIDYDFETAGLTFGMDYRFSEELVAGVAVGYADTSTDLGIDDGDVDTSGYSVSLYGTWFKADRFYLGGSLGYGSNDYDQERVLRYNVGSSPIGGITAVDQTLAADYSGTQYSAVINGGWDFNKNGWTFGPTLRVAYVNVDVDAYTETLLASNVPLGPNAVGWAVQIDDQSYESLQPSVGFEFSKAYSQSWGVMIPQGYVDVVSELRDGSSIITGRFLGDTLEGNDFLLVTDDFEETFARAGLGLGFVLKNNKSAFVTVDADLGRDLLETYYINAGFRWQF